MKRRQPKPPLRQRAAQWLAGRAHREAFGATTPLFAWLAGGLDDSKLPPEAFTVGAAYKHPAVAAAVNVLATRVSAQPLRLEQRANDGWETVPDTDPEARIVTSRWDAYENVETGVERILRSMLLYGSGAAYVERNLGTADGHRCPTPAERDAHGTPSRQLRRDHVQVQRVGNPSRVAAG